MYVDVIDLQNAREETKEAIDEVERIRSQIKQLETQLNLSINRAGLKIIEAQSIENQWLQYQKECSNE